MRTSLLDCQDSCVRELLPDPWMSWLRPPAPPIESVLPINVESMNMKWLSVCQISFRNNQNVLFSRGRIIIRGVHAHNLFWGFLLIFLIVSLSTSFWCGVPVLYISSASLQLHDISDLILVISFSRIYTRQLDEEAEWVSLQLQHLGGRNKFWQSLVLWGWVQNSHFGCDLHWSEICL